MSWFKEDNLRRDENGYILRKDQDKAPELEVGDRFFDVANGRWGLLLRIRPQWEALGAPFEALYDGCDRFAPFIASAMHADIGEVVKLNASR
jgi:hypothetical protein